MFATLFLLGAFGNALSDRDSNAAVMYIQSVSTPALFEACKKVEPGNAARMDQTWESWLKRNKAIVARGESVVRAQAKKDGTDVDEMFRLESEAIVAELMESSVEEQRERCQYFLEVIQSET